jgi:hypothetical protein
MQAGMNKHKRQRKKICKIGQLAVKLHGMQLLYCSLSINGVDESRCFQPRGKVVGLSYIT